MLNVAIVTTMWGTVVEEEGSRRENELKRDVWKRMLADGCAVERFENTYESAWRIISHLDSRGPASVLLPRELVDVGLRLNETQVGVALTQELEKLIEDRKAAARKFNKYANNEHDAQELKEIEVKISQTAEQLERMKIPLARRVRLLFKGRSS